MMEPDREAIAVICYTSGTTGNPKGVQLRHRNIVFGVHTLLTLWEVSSQDRFLLTLPLFHVHSLMLGLFGCFLFGHSAWIREALDADEVLQQLKAQQMTLFMGVPTMYSRFVKSAHLPALRQSSMQLFTSGSTPLSSEILYQFQEITGHTILERYGLSEPLINTSNPYQGEHRPGTVCPDLPGIEDC